MRKVYILFSCDQWFSKDSMRIVGEVAYENFDQCIHEAYVNYLTEFKENISTDKSWLRIDLNEISEGFHEAIRERKQFSRAGLSYLIEELTLK